MASSTSHIGWTLPYDNARVVEAQLEIASLPKKQSADVFVTAIDHQFLHLVNEQKKIHFAVLRHSHGCSEDDLEKKRRIVRNSRVRLEELKNPWAPRGFVFTPIHLT